MHQIKNIYQARYEDEEIVTAAIISMIPSLILWSVLEFTADLTLSQLQHWIEAHLGEQNETNMCNLLTSVVQFSVESCYEFVMRSVQLQQKFMFASNESDTGYNQTLEQKLLLRALERGIFCCIWDKHLPRQDFVGDEDIFLYNYKGCNLWARKKCTIKVGLSTSRKVCFIWFNESPLK